MNPVPLFSDDPQPYADQELEQLVEEADEHSTALRANGYLQGFDILGDIDLPPGPETHIDRDELRALASLYLAADLEPAGVIGSAESFAALLASGAIRVDLGPVGPLLAQFWRNRHDRIDKRERIAFFGSLFGASYGAGMADRYVNSRFEPLMLNLCEALYRLDEMASDPVYGGVAHQSRVRAAAGNLLGNLAQVGGGATAFLSVEVIRLLKEALSILKHPHLRGVLMARDIWGVITSIDRLVHRSSVDPRAFVRRGRAGMLVIVWLADVAAAMKEQRYEPVVRLDHKVIPAAVDWLQASLLISERQGQLVSPPSARLPGTSSQPRTNVGGWTDIGI